MQEVKIKSLTITIVEVNFGLVANPEKQKKKMMKLITQLDARMKSRFMRGTYLPTLNIIASSKDTEQSFLEEFIDNKRTNNSLTTLVIDEPQWVVDNRKDSPEKFWVAVGNKFLPNELLPVDASDELVEEYRSKGHEMWHVPIGYLETFQLNIDEAICSIIGIATASSLKYIAGDRLTQIKTNTYRNPFLKDVIEVGDGKDDFLQYSNFFDLSTVSEEDKARPLFIHLDMSGGTSGKGGDKTGIAGIWITGREQSNHSLLPQLTDQKNLGTAELEQISHESLNNDLHYKLAFSVSVQAPKGENICYSKNRAFIRWLRDQGFAIKKLSSDTFQSTPVLQELKAEGFDIEVVTVDRVQKDANGKPVCLPYHYFKSVINGRQLTIYDKCDLLTDEIIKLERRSDGHIDHPKNFCFTGDTKVALVDGRTLNFLDLVKEYQNGKTNYVYSMNLDIKQIEAKPITKAWQTLRNQKLIKITLDNGEEIKCTYNHKFMLRNGEYIEAQDLLPNDSLMPLYTKVAEKVKERHQAGEYKKAYSAMQEVNAHKKQLKELFPIVDTEKFIEFFGFDYYSIDTSTKAGASKKGVWINRYRQKMYEILNHKVVKIEYLDECEDVYDIEVADNHNFALAAGIFVHNSKDQADAVCGATWLASKFSEEYSYRYGDNLTASLNANEYIDDNYAKQQLMINFEEELKKISLRNFQSDLDENSEEYRRRKEEAEYYDALQDGIIII